MSNDDWIPYSPYEFPNDDDANVKVVKRNAARWARCTFGPTKGKSGAGPALERLKKELFLCETGRLRYWAQVVMIDGRWCGATGAGGYWAAASDIVNREAVAELARRGDGKPSFEILEAG